MSTRPVELFSLASKGISMHKTGCWLPNTLHGIIVSRGICLWEVLLRSRSSAKGIRCEWQSVFPHLSPSGEILTAEPLQTLCLPWLLPTLKLIDFLRYLLYPLEIFPGCPHSRLCFEAPSECQRSWGNFYFTSTLLLQRQRFQQENHSAFKKSIQILSCVSLKHFAGCGFYSGLMFRALRFSPWLSRSWVPVPFPLFAQQRWRGDIGTEVLCQKI